MTRSWDLLIVNRFTGKATSYIRSGYLAGFDWGIGLTNGFASVERSAAMSVALDPVPGRDHLVFLRDNEPYWSGPISGMTDQRGGRFLIAAEDPTTWALGSRSWKTNIDFDGDPARIVERCFLEAEIGDPTGITDIEVVEVGGSLKRSVLVGQRIGQTLDEYSILAPWCLVGSTLHVGLLELDTQLELTEEAWLPGTAGPLVGEDWTGSASRTNIELLDGTVVSWPETYEAGDAGLKEAFFELDVTPEEAMAMAKAHTLRSRHGLYIGGQEGMLSPDFPLDLAEMRPGMLFTVRTEETGSLIAAGDVTQLSTLSVSIQDGQETGVTASFSPAFLDGT